jgi:MFS family permease
MKLEGKVALVAGSHEVAQPAGDAAAPRPWDCYTSRQRLIFLGLLFLVATSASIDRLIVGVLVEPIKQEFQVSDAMLGLMSGFAFAIFYGTMGIPVARWADRGNRKFILTTALAIWSIMTAVCGLAQTFFQLVLIRIAVGVGEAGGVPPGQSLLADYFPPEQRARALGVFTTSTVAGYIFGIIVGGQLTQAFGWRVTFLLIGVPGLLLALACQLVLKEPRRLPQFAVQKSAIEPFAQSLRVLLGKRSYVDLVIGATLYFMVIYGAFVFQVAFLMRSFHLPVGQASAIFGTLSAATGIFGSIVGGVLADRMARKDITWSVRLPALTALVAWPVYELAFLSPSLALATGFLAIGSFLVCAGLPCMYASVHIVCGSPRRATSVAILLLLGNLFGIGLGPLLTGYFSDTLARSVGTADGLRYALMIMSCLFLLVGTFALRSARNIARDRED